MATASRWTGLLLLVLAGATARADESDRPRYPWQLVPERAILGHLFDGWFVQPSSVWFDAAAEEVLVADRRTGRIGVYDLDGVPLFTFGKVPQPNSIAVDPEGNVLVLGEDRSQIHRYSYRGTLLEPLLFFLPEDEEGAPPLRLAAFTVDAEGNYYVAATEDPQVLVYRPDLSLRTRIRPARAAARFERITALAVAADGKIAVTDGRSTPVQLFSPSGRFLGGFGEWGSGSRSFSLPVSVAFDAAGYLYVADMPKHHVKVFTVDGRLDTIFGGRFGPGTGGRAPGEMTFPTSVAVQPGGLVFVAERYGRRVQIFRRLPLEEGQG